MGARASDVGRRAGRGDDGDGAGETIGAGVREDGGGGARSVGNAVEIRKDSERIDAREARTRDGQRGKAADEGAEARIETAARADGVLWLYRTQLRFRFALTRIVGTVWLAH